MTIKIIGSNTSNGIKLKKTIIKLANTIEETVIINLIDDKTLTNLPYFYINDTLISKGTVPQEREILKYFKKKYKQ